jgi:lysophospholipase L1-like esterase
MVDVTWTKAAVIAVVVAAGAAVAVFVSQRDPAGPPVAVPTRAATTAASSPAPSASGPWWVGTWAVAVQRGTTTFTDRTIRQVVRTSIGGSAARLRLANQYGTAPLVVRNIAVARSTGGSGVDTDTSRPVTFGGATEVTVPAGGSVASDPVDFAVPALGDVAVSFHLPETSGPATIHGLAGRNNYVAAGDQAAAGTLDGARKAASYYFLAGLDVVNDRAAGAVVAFGASVTDGFGATLGDNQRWPDLLAERLAASGRTVGVINTGISGNKLTKDGSGDSALSRFDRDVLGQPGARWVIISDDALNDLGDPDPPPADEIIAAMRRLADRAHDGGLEVLCSTLTPFEGAGYWSSRAEAGRAAVNAYLRGPGSGCDAVVDQDTATHDPGSPTRFRDDLNSGDHLHPNDAGMRAIADAVDLAVFD